MLDPGHSPTVHAVDPRSGIRVDEYENEPEMRDVFAVAVLVKQRLSAAGYRVVITKKTARSKMNLAKRAAIANNAHAALALSIHDQAGAHGGIAFTHGNNVVYYQSVGSYRTTVTGKKVSFTDTHLAAISKKYGAIFAKQRRTAEHHRIVLKKNVGYNLGTRGKPAGNMWTVQLLSKVPWIYNEAGGNSAGRSGLSDKDKHRYADGLVASVQKCVPIKH